MVKPSCLGVLVVSMVAGDEVEGRSATAAALTEDDRDAQICLPAHGMHGIVSIRSGCKRDTAWYRKPCRNVPCAT